MNELDEILKHYGVKGMRWGVRRNRNRPGGADGKRQNGSKKSTTVKDEAKSALRELSWAGKSKVNNMNKMSTKDIKKQTERLRLENDLKKLSRDISLGTSKDRKDYRGRANMSDQELRRKVDRLRAKKEFKNQANQATKSQIEKGKTVVKLVAPMVIGYAVAKNPNLKETVKKLNTKENRDLALQILKVAAR